MDIRVKTGSKRKAKIIYQAIVPETSSFNPKRSITDIKNLDTAIHISIKATDISAARASVNGVLRWINMCDGIITAIE